MQLILTINVVDSNLDLKVGMGKRLSEIKSMPTSWQWTYTKASRDLRADVSYDLWLSAKKGSTGATADSSFEV